MSATQTHITPADRMLAHARRLVDEGRRVEIFRDRNGEITLIEKRVHKEEDYRRNGER